MQSVYVCVKVMLHFVCSVDVARYEMPLNHFTRLC